MSSTTKKRVVYLDNAASTPIEPSVKKEIVETMELYGNPSAFNNIGRLARNKLYQARSTIGKFIGARPGEVIFTSSGSEANNLAIFGLAGMQSKPGEIITTPIEHSSVLEPLRILAGKGWKITFLNVDKDGLISLKDLEKKLNPHVALVSVIYANNEIGTVQPIIKISKLIKNLKFKKQPLFHIDACQAAGYLDVKVNNLGVDLMTFNSTKIYGPRGVGVLYVKSGTILRPQIVGGDQEASLRAGTENLPAIAGLAKAVSLINSKDGEKVSELRDYFLDNIKKSLPDLRINGPVGRGLRLANNINISVPDMDSESLLLEFDRYGIYVSAGSACTARSVEPSHVLRAIGVNEKYIHGALRLSLGRQTTKKDIDYVLKIMPGAIQDIKKRYAK